MSDPETPENGIKVKGYGIEAGANGRGLQTFALLLAFLMTTGAFVYAMHLNTEKVISAGDRHASGIIETLDQNRSVQTEFKQSIKDLAKQQEWERWQGQMFRCIDIIERLPEKERVWYWERWGNKDQVRVKCPFLGKEPS